MYSVILCGGSGSRLWPLSRKNFPKQFLRLLNEKSLLQETFLRVLKLTPIEKIFFVTNKDNYFNVFNQLKSIDSSINKRQILIEPKSLNTAPAIAFAVKHLIENVKIDPDIPIAIFPSDHYIGDEKKFIETLLVSAKEVKFNIGTIGIVPKKAETGYGYIKKGESKEIYYKVQEFKEKPDKNTAKNYLDSGNYLWNSGIYIFKGNVFIEEMRAHSNEMYSVFSQNFDEFLNSYHLLKSESIDYAISEKSNRIITFEGDFGWSDVGSFDTFLEIKSKNNSFKEKPVIKVDSENIFVHSVNNRLVATIGIKDLIIIENNDSLLLCKRGESGRVREVVDKLKSFNLKEIDDDIIVYKPWGEYRVLTNESNLKVKKIIVYPGEKLSLQYHYHRAENWIVVRGVAKVFNNEENMILKENESTFIPANTKHCLENPGKINLEIIEVQTGDYLEEDDIIRCSDIYNRE